MWASFFYFYVDARKTNSLIFQNKKSDKQF